MNRYLLLFLIFIGCNNDDAVQQSFPDSNKSVQLNDEEKQDVVYYNNDRFKNVTIKQLSPNTFHVEGKARVFEAAFSWVVEDGHNEIAEGHEMTDAGAPDWGNFSFTVTLKNVEQATIPHLILFEASAKDGSRQSELVVPLK